jgi:hypothetical protein
MEVYVIKNANKVTKLSAQSAGKIVQKISLISVPFARSRFLMYGAQAIIFGIKINAINNTSRAAKDGV